MFRKNRQLPDDQREFPITFVGENELDPPRPGLFGALDPSKIEPVARLALTLQCIQRPDYVLDRYRFAVVPACLRSQRENDPRPIGRYFHALGDESVLRERLIGATGQ